MSLEDVYLAFVGTRRDTSCPGHTPPQTRMVQPLGHKGHVGHHDRQAGQGEAGPAHEVEMLLAALGDAGRDLDPVLAHHLRETLAPLSRQARAELVAIIDDFFEAAIDVENARHHSHRLLSCTASHENWQGVLVVPNFSPYNA